MHVKQQLYKECFVRGFTPVRQMYNYSPCHAPKIVHLSQIGLSSKYIENIIANACMPSAQNLKHKTSRKF